MRVGRFTFALLLISAAALPASAQSLGADLSPVQIAVACAPPPVTQSPQTDPMRVLGAQASELKSVLGVGDTIVIGAGANRGVAAGQEYFVRRLIVDPSLPAKNRTWPVHTSGWLTIVAANDTTAIAAVQNVCGPIHAGDFLEPFIRPNPPANVEQVDTSGQLDFGALGRVLHGNDAHDNAAVGDFMLIDQGADRGIAPGARVAVYRDPGRQGVPLVAIGEAAVVSVGPAMSLVRVNQAVGEIRTGDYIVPRR
jgi:hypothetical protein